MESDSLIYTTVMISYLYNDVSPIRRFLTTQYNVNIKSYQIYTH